MYLSASFSNSAAEHAIQQSGLMHKFSYLDEVAQRREIQLDLTLKCRKCWLNISESCDMCAILVIYIYIYIYHTADITGINNAGDISNAIYLTTNSYINRVTRV